MFTNKVCLFVVLGAMCRFWQGYTISYYAYSYFTEFHHDDQFSILNAMSVLVGGFGSNLIAGQISDRFEAKNNRIKPYLMVLMSGCGVITASLCFLFQFSFYFSMTMLFLLYLLAEGWMSPAVSMIQVSIDVRYKGVAMGVFLFATSLTGTAATLVVGVMDTKYHVKEQIGKGKVIWLNTALPCVLAMVFFYISGIYYDRFRRNLAKEVEEVQEKASQF